MVKPFFMYNVDEYISNLYNNSSVLYSLLKECESRREVDKEYLLHRVKLGELKVYHNPVNDMVVFYNAV